MLQLELVRSSSFQMSTLELLSQGTELQPDSPYSCFVDWNCWERFLSQSSALPCLLVLTPADQGTSHWSCARRWHLLTLPQHLGNSSCTVSTTLGVTQGHPKPHTFLLQPWGLPGLRCVELGTGLAPSPSVPAVPDLFQHWHDVFLYYPDVKQLHQPTEELVTY